MSPPESASELRKLAMLPRPWEPPTCPSELRRLMYTWLDEVTAWINEEHTRWGSTASSPAAGSTIRTSFTNSRTHELTTASCLRWEAEYAVSAAVLEEWHRYTLPMFLERIQQRIGSTSCPPGSHQPNPGDSRNGLYRGQSQSAGRRRRRVSEPE